MDEADIRKKEWNAFADFLRRVMPTSSYPASKSSHPPLKKTRRGTQTDVTSSSGNIFPEQVDDDDEDNNDDDDNFIQN